MGRERYGEAEEGSLVKPRKKSLSLKQKFYQFQFF